MKLNYEGFENNLFKVSEKLREGVRYLSIQYLFKFDNGYGASVVNCYYYGYCNRYKPWELAVVKFDSDDNFELDYDTDITDDVIGYLDDEEVRNLLKRISELND